MKSRGANNAMDKNVKTYFTSNFAKDWLQIDLTKEYLVTGLDVTKQASFETHFKNMEVSERKYFKE